MKVGDEVYYKESGRNIKGKVKSVICGAEEFDVYWSNGFSNLYKESELILASEVEKEEPKGDGVTNDTNSVQEILDKRIKGHPNAAILMEIAKEAAINPEYWKEFEVATYETTIWSIPESMFHLYQCLCDGTDVRRKPRTIRIGNYYVKHPEELRLSEANPNYVFINMDSVCDAELMLKALQELLAGKQ